MNCVSRRIRGTREQRYRLFRGFYRRVTDGVGNESGELQPRLEGVIQPMGSAEVGKPLKERDLSRLNVEVTAIGKRNIPQFAGGP